MKRNLCRCLLTLGGLLLPCTIQVSQAQDAFPPGPGGAPPGGFPGGPGGDALNAPQGQPGFPGFAPSPDLFQPMPIMMPEIAQKTLQIAVLRELNELRMSEKEVDAALNALKQIQNNDKALQTTVLQILDEEKKALLSARPDAPVQHNAGDRMQQASEQLREKQDGIWRGLAQAIGGPRIGALREMLGLGGGNPMPGAPGGGFNGPNNRDPNFRPQGQPGQPGPGGQRPPNGRPGGGRQPGADNAPNPVGQPGQPPLPGQPGGQNGRDPFFNAPGGRGQNVPGQFDPFRAPGQPGQPGQQNGQNRQFGQFGQPGQPGWEPARFPGFQQGGNNPFGNGAGWRQHPHISLKEMIDLLQEKLSAMRK